MNRNYYCKVNSQKEADELLDRLKKTGEFVTNLYTLEPDWIYIGMKKDEGRWAIISRSYFVDNAIKVPASELIDYVTGKKLDKDALLEEAKRRYPVGTKFKRAHAVVKDMPIIDSTGNFKFESCSSKSKTSLGVEDLVKGAIYCSLMSDKPQWESLHLYHGNGENMFKYRLYIHSSYKGNDKFDKSDWGKCTSNQYRLATSLEKKWLKTCIKQDKFIEQSELDKYDDEGNLMESKEYPEYYECIKPELWENTIKSNNGNLIFSGNFITKTRNTIEHEHLHQYGHFKISTKAAYDAQFKKDKDYKIGDWILLSTTANGWGCGPEWCNKIVQISQIEPNEKYIQRIYFKIPGGEKRTILKEVVRKVSPHEIPVENSVKQYPYTPEESIKLDFEVKWKELRYIGGVDSITATGWGIYEQMKKQPIQSRKTPDLIDKSKVEVKIKRTKVKQIKL